jgi:hypothetical protein
MKHLVFLVALLGFCVALPSAAQTTPKADVCLKIGGSYFINCKRTIAFGEYSILTVSGNDSTGRMVNFDIYSSSGTLDASLKDGNFSGTNDDSYTVAHIQDGFAVSDKRNSRLVLKVVNVFNKEENRSEMQVWGDFFLPNGGRFICTPETSNVPMLEMMKGNTFQGAGTGIQLD